ncbi:hypothetical protein AB0K62_14345 [Streptomyces halstedii]|uniref:hypothetical protein n=1 Tax=Streptomyces TaxID=1883 RepID=UPI0004A95318|nr:hypothetical protein [Streptomyces sp. NTK 937]KDQ67342.1 hypothetical protein DT87_08950 [Streptomyces sp. NTK 937]WSX38103.1 hypothetical protein OG291_21885 [Streptomyces halstedii]
MDDIDGTGGLDSTNSADGTDGTDGTGGTGGIVDPAPAPGPTEVLLIGGRAGVGKTTVGWEISDRLREAAVAHAILEGDYLGQVHPAPPGDPHRSAVTEANLTAVWGTYAALGHRRLVYTNTVSVLPDSAPMFERALGPGVRIIRVLLTATDTTTLTRLTAREIGSALDRELAGSARKSRLLDAHSPPDTVRVATDDRTVGDIAAEVLAVTGWMAPDTGGDGGR